jgi:hypothetical protein
MSDFRVNYQAAQRLRLGETLYRTADSHWQFKYMPFSAFLYLPLTVFPLTAAKAIWYAVVVISEGLILYLSARLLQPGTRKTAFLAAATWVLLGRYFLREIQLGQINALITGLLLLMIRAFDFRGTSPAGSSVSGASWGLATALKPYSLIYLPYLLAKRKWTAVAAGIFVLGLAALAPALFYGFRGNLTVLKEWQSTLAASTPSLFSSQDNVSLMGFLAKWTGRQSLALIFYFMILFLLGGLILYLLFLGKHVSRAFVLESFLLLALIPLISPLGWDYTLIAAAPAVMLILAHFKEFPPFARYILVLDLALIAFSLYDLMGRALYARFMSWSVITVNFLILIGYLAFLRIKKYA